MIVVGCTIEFHERSITGEVDQRRLRCPARKRGSVQLKDALDVIGPGENGNRANRRNLEGERLAVLVAAPLEEAERPVGQPGPLNGGRVSWPGRQEGIFILVHYREPRRP